MYIRMSIIVPEPLRSIEGYTLQAILWEKGESLPVREQIILDGVYRSWYVVAVDDKTRIITMVQLTHSRKRLLKG